MWSPILFFAIVSIMQHTANSLDKVKCDASQREHYSCGSACDRECHRLNIPCRIINIKCVDRCYCDEGYARDLSNRCVPINQCVHTCGDNEELRHHVRSCPPETCFSLVAKFKCDSREVGQTRCACKEGFLRKNINSPCIPLRNCPELANSPDFN
ncbi:inducible metalloproteinase inhibitor protein-like [Battus philenor]|uniref:inducible metalloproteinase inhibitor protein-like n=1 Tax=Battus philenor TaxID=42288 RepID=UPI0035CFA8BC